MYILIDIGGTKTRIAKSINLESFSNPVIFQTPEKFEDGIEAIKKTVKDICGDEEVKAVACGIAASTNREKTKIVNGGPNIKDWLNKPLKESFEEAFGCSVFIENDTAMGGLAQVSYGPAKGVEIAVYITVSTGVGGCRFVDGKIDKSAMGFEPGWQIIGNPEIGQPDRLTNNGWLGGYCSKGYLISHIGGVCVERAEGKKPYEIADSDFWEKKAKLFAYGLHNICTIWSPDIIVVGGSMMKKIGIPLEHVENHLKKTLADVFPDNMPKIEPAQFGDEMGLHGAMAYLKQKTNI
jgi:predicted NBD/HSP70 family sugar kinase